MNRRRLLLVAGALALVLWVGYAGYVFNMEAFTSEQETVVMAGDEASPGGNVSAHVQVRDHATGERLADSDVDVYLARNGTRRAVDAGRTDGDGSYTATFPAPTEPADYQLQVEADSRIGSDTVTTELNVSRDYSLLVDTDKPVYRPGSAIQIRTVVRERGAGPVTDEATVTVTDPDGNRLFSRDVALDEFGTANATLPLSSVAATGRYDVRVAVDGESRTRTVTVKEYTTPQFDVQFRQDRSYYRPGETLSATVVSEYFFGEPVGNATVTVEGEGYVGDMESFGSVETETDGDGVATVELELPEYFAARPDSGGKGLVALNISVTDEAGVTETVTRRVPVAQEELVVNAYPAGGEVVPGVENTVYVTAEYPDGRPAQATVALNGETVETNRLGVGTYRFTPDEEFDQRFHLRARTGDARVERTVYMDVARDQPVTLQLDRATYDVGDTVRGQVFVAEGAGTVYLDVISGKQTVLTKTVETNGSRGNVSFSVPPSAAGAVKVRAWTVLRNEQVGASARQVLVRPAEAVNVTVESGRSTYRPGENATLTVSTRQNGSGVPAAVGIDVVDESVFAVEEDRAGLAAVNYDLEQELQEPGLFVHDVGDGPGTKNDGTDTTTGGSGDRSAVSVARQASLSRLSTDPGGVARNSYVEKRQRIDRKQTQLRQTNGLLWVLALVLLPLGFVAVEGWRMGVGQFVGHVLGLGVGVLFAIVGWFVAFLFTVIFLQFAGWIGLVLALTVGLVALLYRAAHSNVGLDRMRATDWRLVAALGLLIVVLGARALFDEFLTVDGHGLFLIGAVFAWALAFVTYAARAASDDRWRSVGFVVAGVALVVVGAFVLPFVAGFGGQSSANDGGMAMQGATGGGDAGFDASAGGDGSASADGASGGTAADDESDGGTQVRQYFPETAASRTVVTGTDGTATTQLQLPDSITTWRVSSIASSSEGSLGSDRSSVRVFQSFFVQPDLPVALTQNDSVTVPVSVYNYENTSTTVTVELEGADWYRAANETRTVELGPNEVGGVSFRVTALRNGEFPLTMVAVSERANGTQTADAVRKRVTVEPRGRERSSARSGSLAGETTATVTVPERAVANSPQTVLRVYPGAFGQVVQGMEALLAKPTGCFEQTSSSLYPNVLALRYMERTGETSPEVRTRAERFIAAGYQRLLTFETDTEGGYSLFGDDPANLLLTSYGLMEMSDMNRVYEVDPSTIEEMQQFVRSEQRSDGSWAGDGRLEYSIGVSGDSLSTTAYVTWSLAHSGAEGQAVDDGAAYVRENLDVAETDTRTLAVVLNMLVDAEKYPDLQQRIAGKLADRATTDDDGVRWESTGDGESDYHSGDRSVLTTAMVANGFAKGGYEHGLTDQALSWIVEQKSGDGGWGGTQNTVFALKALVNAQTASGEAPTGTLSVSHDGETVETREITDRNRDEVQTFVLPAATGDNEYTVDPPGDGDLYYELETTYHEPWADGERPDANSPVSMTVSYDRTNLTVDDTVRTTVRVENDAAPIGTALVSLTVPPGFTADQGSLDELRERGTISRYELGGRQIVLYVEDLEGSVTLEFSMRATTPVEARGGAGEITDYYDPDTGAVAAPVRFHVRGNATG